MINFCDQCGAKLEAGAAFCTSCGAKIADMEQAQAAAAAPAPEPAVAPEPVIASTPESTSETGAEPMPESEPAPAFVQRNIPSEAEQAASTASSAPTGDETMYLGVDALAPEPETVEQIFERTAPKIVLHKERSGEDIRITKPVWIFGKNPNHADFAIRDNATVSRIHASLTWDETGYTLADLGSMNGTFINEERIGTSGRLLKDGDVIKLSDEPFTVAITGAQQ